MPFSIYKDGQKMDIRSAVQPVLSSDQAQVQECRTPGVLCEEVHLLPRQQTLVDITLPGAEMDGCVRPAYQEPVTLTLPGPEEREVRIEVVRQGIVEQSPGNRDWRRVEVTPVVRNVLVFNPMKDCSLSLPAGTKVYGVTSYDGMGALLSQENLSNDRWTQEAIQWKQQQPEHGMKKMHCMPYTHPRLNQWNKNSDCRAVGGGSGTCY